MNRIFFFILIAPLSMHGMETSSQKLSYADIVKKEFENAPPDAPICIICRDVIACHESQITRLACRHLFHRGCIAPWLAEHSKCPLCNQLIRQPRR